MLLDKGFSEVILAMCNRTLKKDFKLNESDFYNL